MHARAPGALLGPRRVEDPVDASGASAVVHEVRREHARGIAQIAHADLESHGQSAAAPAVAAVLTPVARPRRRHVIGGHVAPGVVGGRRFRTGATGADLAALGRFAEGVERDVQREQPYDQEGREEAQEKALGACHATEPYQLDIRVVKRSVLERGESW